MLGMMPECFGILNITSDSFSDGGSFLLAENAKSQANALLSEGADWIEVSGQSSNVKAELVSEEEEWRRIAEILPFLHNAKAKISIDSFRPLVQEKALDFGVQCLNDISGFTHPNTKSLLKERLLANKNLNLIVMHSHTLGIAKEKSSLDPSNVVPTILKFFEDRKRELLSWGISEERIYFDPGMGFFLGDDPELSFAVLRDLKVILAKFPKLMVSVSRKSFLGNVLGGLKVTEREFASLAVEIYLLQLGVPWIRTHNVKKIKQAEMLFKKLNLLPT